MDIGHPDLAEFGLLVPHVDHVIGRPEAVGLAQPQPLADPRDGGEAKPDLGLVSSRSGLRSRSRTTASGATGQPNLQSLPKKRMALRSRDGLFTSPYPILLFLMPWKNTPKTMRPTPHLARPLPWC